MKYYSIVYPDENNNPVVCAYSEAEILLEYKNYFIKQIQAAGKILVDQITDDDIIDNWIVVNWAYEISEKQYYEMKSGHGNN